MSLSEFILSEFWFILLIISMLLCKPYRIPGMFLLVIKIINVNNMTAYIVIMVTIGVLLESQKLTSKFLSKQKYIKKSEID